MNDRTLNSMFGHLVKASHKMPQMNQKTVTLRQSTIK